MPGSILDYDKRDVVASVRAQRERTLALLDPLAPPDWERIVTPGWRVREVAAHLVSTDEASLTGRLLALGVRQRSVAEIEAWNDEQVARWSDRPVASLLHALGLWGRRMARAIATVPGRVAARPIPTPFGTVSLSWLGMLRVYDEWVHGEDVRRAFSMAPDDGPEAIAPVARHLLAVIPFQTLPRISPSARGSVRVAFGDVEAPRFVVDLSSRRYGALDDADATITARAAPLVMVAAGRDPWRDAEAAGDIAIAGAREPAEVFLDALLAV